MDAGQPAVRTLSGRDEGVCVCVIEGLAHGYEPESGGEETKRRVPGPQGVGDDLTKCADGEHGPRTEELTEVGVGESGRDPTEEVGAIADF